MLIGHNAAPLPRSTACSSFRSARRRDVRRGYRSVREGSTMRTLIGFDHYTVAERGLTPEGAIAFACDHEFEGIQFLEPAQIDAELATERLAEFRGKVADAGLYLE